MIDPKLVIYSDGKRKGRAFEGVPLAYAWMEEDKKEVLRPALLIVCTSQDEARPLGANLRAGRKALLFGEGHTSSGDLMELPKSRGYRAPDPSYFPEEGAVVLTYFDPDLFDLVPSAAKEDAYRFLVMPSTEDAAALVEGLEHEVETSVRYALSLGYPRAPIDTAFVHLAAFAGVVLGHHAELPIPDRLPFRTQFLLAALEKGLASFSLRVGFEPERWGQHAAIGFRSVVNGIGMHRGVAVAATKAQMEALLIEQVTIFDQQMRAFRARRIHGAP